MQLEARKLLDDVRRATDLIVQFTSERVTDDHLADALDDHVVWDFMQKDVPVLRQEVEALLQQSEGT